MTNSTAQLPGKLDAVGKSTKGRKKTIQLAEDVIKRTQFVCGEYNEILSDKDGELLSGLCVASSILIGDASMLNLFKSQEQVDGVPKASPDAKPELDDLACLAIKFFRDIIRDKGGLDALNDLLEAATSDPGEGQKSTSVYGAFIAGIKNQHTKNYVREGAGPPRQQGGGSINFLLGGADAAKTVAAKADRDAAKIVEIRGGSSTPREDALPIDFFISHFERAVENVEETFREMGVGFDMERIAEAVFCAPSYDLIKDPICAADDTQIEPRQHSFFLRDQQSALFMQYYCDALEEAEARQRHQETISGQELQDNNPMIDEIPTIIAQMIKDLLSNHDIQNPENIDPIKLILAMGSEMDPEEQGVFYDIAMTASVVRDMERADIQSEDLDLYDGEIRRQLSETGNAWLAQQAALGPETAGEQAPGDEESAAMSLELPEVHSMGEEAGEEAPGEGEEDDGMSLELLEGQSMNADIPVPPEEEQVRDDLGSPPSPPQTQPDSPSRQRRRKKKKGRRTKPKRSGPRKRNPRSRTRNKSRRRKPRSRSGNMPRRKPRSKSKRKQPKKKSMKERLRKTLNKWLQ